MEESQSVQVVRSTSRETFARAAIKLSGAEPVAPPKITHEEDGEPPEPAKLEDDAVTPLEYLLRIINDPSQPAARRDKAALAALPYLHKKQVATTGSAPNLPPGINPKSKTGQRAIAAATSHQGTPWGDVLDESGAIIGTAGDQDEQDA